MMNALRIGGSKSSTYASMGPITAPQTNSYKRVLYGSDHSKPIVTPSAHPGETPTLSTLKPPEVTQATKAQAMRLDTLEETIKTVSKRTREDLMAEMRALTAKSDARTRKLENLTSSTETLMLDFVSNSKTQAEELNTCYTQMAAMTNLTTTTTEKWRSLRTR